MLQIPSTPVDTAERLSLRAEGIVKTYGGVHALRGASLELAAGEVHGLVGENGSGKSTLLKVISGQLQPQGGRLWLDGRETRFADSRQAVDAGVVAVTQETTLVPGLSVAENILLGPRKPRTWRGIDWRATHREAAAALDRLQLDVPLDAEVGRLRPDQQQMVEIARAISMNARVLILDEPTSSLDDDEAEALFDVVGALKRDGLAIVFVSHRMSEIFKVVDRITILRDGSVVESGSIAGYDRGRLIELMTGRALREAEAEVAAAVSAGPAGEAPILEVRGLSVPGRVRNVDLTVARGSIAGLAGLVGAGRTELMRALFGLVPHATGIVRVDGRDVRPTGPAGAMREGIAFVPGDRKQLGLVLDMSVRENLLMARSAPAGRLRRPGTAAERRAVDAAVADFRIRLGSPADEVWRLSGGNQQKVVLAKWLGTEPRILMLDEPTRGVDVGAKADIYRLLRGLRDAGLTILVSSSEVPELLTLCDRIHVLHRGRVMGSVDAARADEALITQMAMGHATEVT